MAGIRRTVDVHKGRMNSSYFAGPLLDINRRADNRSKLFVGNVPLHFSKADIESIFEQYGYIVTSFLGPPKLGQKYTWALVEYDNPVNANLAINELDGRPPYKFVVNVSMSEEEKIIKNIAKQQYDELEYNRTMVPPRRFNYGQLANYTNDEDYAIDDLLHTDDLEYDEEDCEYDGRNYGAKTNMRGVMMVVDRDGERQFTVGPRTLGPAYPIETVSKEMRQTIDVAITNMMNKLQKRSGTGDSGDKCFGSCAVCGMLTVNACSICQLWYCGRKCQLSDWQQHVRYCAPIPELKSMQKDKHLEPRDGNVFKHPSSYRRADTDRKDEARFGNKNLDSEERSKVVENDANRHVDERNKVFESKNSSFDKTKSFGEKNRNFEDKKKGFGNDRNSKSLKNDKCDFGRPDDNSLNASSTEKNYVQDAENTQFWDDNVKTTSTPVKDEDPSPLLLSASLSKQVKPTPLKEADVISNTSIGGAIKSAAMISLPLLPIGVSKQVTVSVVLGEGHYYVVPNDMVPSYKEMLSRLQKAAKNAECLTPVEKAKCFVYSDNVWLRGIVRSVSPLLVHFVDYGNSELFTANAIKAIPEEFAKFPRMAMRIKVAPGSRREFYHHKENDTFFVKTTARDADGALIVDVLNAESTSPSVSNYKDKPAAGKSSSSLPPHVFTQVLVSSVQSESDLGVQRKDSLNNLLDILARIIQEAPKAKPITPELGVMCLGEYQGDWYRGQIISLSPLKVLFIDYGNEEVCTADQLRVLSSELSVLLPQAIKIRLAEGTPKAFLGKQIDDTLEVKPVSEDKNRVIVHVKGHEYPVVTKPEPVPVSQSTSADSKCNGNRNVIDFLKNSYTGLYVVKCNSKQYFIGTVACTDLEDLNNSLLLNLPKALEEQAYDQSFKPKINEVVGILYKEEQNLTWGRAIQHLKDKFVCCDTGLEVTPLKLKKLPTEFDNLPYLAAFCVLQNFKEDIEKYFKVGSYFIFDVHKINSDGSVKVSLKSDNKDIDIGECTSILKPWQPYSFEPRNVLKSGASVTLAFFYSYDALYVLFEQPESLGFFNQLKEEVKAVPQLDSDPEIGSLVACQFSVDKEWYRANILNKVGNEYEVFFVDYGNKEVTTISNMKPIPRRFRDVPYHAIKVGLANKLNKPFTKEALEFLNRISADEESLQIVFENNDLTSVVLQRSTGENLNEELNTIMDKNWKKQQKKPLSSKDFLSVDDLPKYELNTGTEMELTVLLLSHPRVLFVCDSKSQAFKDVTLELSSKLQEYYAGLPGATYEPAEFELCAAVFEEDKNWYRAMCFETIEDESKVMFIDYGNECTVKHSNIRKLTQDFVKTPAMGFLCIYDAIPKDCPKSLKKRVEELVVSLNTYKFTVKSQDEGCYYVDVPSVTLTLQKEGLL